MSCPTMKTSAIFVLLIALWKESEALDKSIDLGRVVDENSVHWPRVAPFTFTKKDRQSTDSIKWLALNNFATGEHISTHLDAPFGFNKNGWKVGDIPLDNLIGPGICINLQYRVEQCEPTNCEGNVILTPADIYQWETKYGKIKKGSIVLVKFGWGQYYGTRRYFYNKNVDNVLSFPGVSKEAVEVFVAREIVGIGVDSPSIDRGSSQIYEAHQTLATHNIFGLENLRLPVDLPERGYNIIAMPMKIREGTGAPVRVIAVPLFKND